MSLEYRPRSLLKDGFPVPTRSCKPRQTIINWTLPFSKCYLVCLLLHTPFPDPVTPPHWICSAFVNLATLPDHEYLKPVFWLWISTPQPATQPISVGLFLPAHCVVPVYLRPATQSVSATQSASACWHSTVPAWSKPGNLSAYLSVPNPCMDSLVHCVSGYGWPVSVFCRSTHHLPHPPSVYVPLGNR